MNTREILTLQFGHYSNYVGTHWWNMQELGFDYNSKTPSEINHDVLFREGLTSKGEVTFTPRLLLVDLKGSLKALSQRGTLYDPPTRPDQLDVPWPSPPEIKEEPKTPKSSFQKELDKEGQSTVRLEDDVTVWSDFLCTRFHPRTVNVIKEYEHENDSLPFNAFPLGRNLWEGEVFREDFSDKVRNYVEECDCFQGFQIILDSTDANAGLSTSCMEYLHDEYENKSIFALPLIPSHHRDYNCVAEGIDRFLLYDLNRTLNVGFCYASLTENASLFVPLCTGTTGWKKPGAPRKFNHVNYNDELWYHSSAILASALDTFTLKYRQRGTSYSLSDLAVDLTPHGRKAAAASLCLPFSLNQGADLIDCLDAWDGPLSQSITPNCEIETSYVMQLIGFRGVKEDRLKRPASQASKQRDMPAYKCDSIRQMLEMYYAFTCHGSATNVTNIEKGLTVKTPYPSIIDKKIGADGNVVADARPKHIGIETIPVLSGLHTGAEVGTMLDSLHTEVKKIKFPRFNHFITAGLDKDEFTETLDKLLTLRECYEDNYLL